MISDMKIPLPAPEFPTGYSVSADAYQAPTNTFTVMPVTASAEIADGDFLRINLATYTDPGAELDFQAQHPRWMQGVLLRIDEIRDAFPYHWYYPRYGSNAPADRVFRGAAVDRGAEMAVPVVGVMHPRKRGWLSFEPDAFGEISLETIADLKAQLGKISITKAHECNTKRRKTGAFFTKDGVHYT